MTSRIEGARSGPTARDINLRDTRCSRRQLTPSSHRAPLSPRLSEKSTLHKHSTMVSHSAPIYAEGKSCVGGASGAETLQQMAEGAINPRTRNAQDVL